PQRLADLDTGRVVELTASPTEALVALTNHRNELLVADLRGDRPALTRLDHSRFGRIEDPAWSPDGRWVAYARPNSAQTAGIRLARVDTGQTHEVSAPVRRDRRPACDPKGRYLYFIGQRGDHAVPDGMHDLEHGFPLADRLYAVTLRA